MKRKSYDSAHREIKHPGLKGRPTTIGKSSGNRPVQDIRQKEGELHENGEMLNITEFFNSYERDCAKVLDNKKKLIMQYTEKCIAIYSSKLMKLIQKHETQLNDLKATFEHNIKTELEEWVNYIAYIRKEEKKFIGMFNHLKKIYNSPKGPVSKTRKIIELYDTFNQKYSELMKAHRIEAEAAKKALDKEVKVILENSAHQVGDHKIDLIRKSYCATYMEKYSVI